jgi:hypothetical protein
MDKHLEKFNEYLKGKTIKEVEWVGNNDMENLMWYKRPVIIHFTDGSFLIPMADDEGNDGGSLMYQGKEGNDTIYVDYYSPEKVV